MPLRGKVDDERCQGRVTLVLPHGCGSTSSTRTPLKRPDRKHALRPFPPRNTLASLSPRASRASSTSGARKQTWCGPSP